MHTIGESPSAQRFLVGAAGGVAPSLLNIVVVDWTNVFRHPDILVLVFYLVRFTFLMLLGGLWAYLHKKERDLVQLFQLGIVAPAVIMGVVNGTNVPKSAEVPAKSTGLEIVFAQGMTPLCEKERVKQFELPRETPQEQIVRGLTAAGSNRTLFVVVGFYGTIEAARAGVADIANKTSGFVAEVYCSPNRYQPIAPFAVVIGANLSPEEANTMLARGLKAGLVQASLFDLAAP